MINSITLESECGIQSLREERCNMEMQTTNKRSFGKKSIVNIVSHPSVKFSEIIHFISENEGSPNDKILFFSFTRSYVNMMKTLLESPNLYDNLFIVDFVTKYIIDWIEDKNTVIYRMPPENLDMFKQLILKLLNQSNNNIIVIDSLNQLLSIADVTNRSLDNFINFLNAINSFDDSTHIENILFFYNKMNIVFSDYIENLKTKVVTKEI